MEIKKRRIEKVSKMLTRARTQGDRINKKVKKGIAVEQTDPSAGKPNYFDSDSISDKSVDERFQEIDVALKRIETLNA